MDRVLRHIRDSARDAYRGAGASATVEWTWLTGRVLVALVLIPAGLTVFSGYAGAGAVTAAGVAVLVYSVGLAWLLKKGLTNLTFKIGFAFDNVLVLAAWWWTVHDGFPASAQNDFWLALLPTLIVGVVRFGPRVGLLYVGTWLLVYAWLVLTYQEPGSYSVRQLPIRIVFTGIVGVLVAWLVSRLRKQHRLADSLRLRTERVAEIGRIVSSNINTAAVFPEFAAIVRELVPYERFSLVDIDLEDRTFRALSSDGAPADGPAEAVAYAIPRNERVDAFFSRREPVLADEQQCKRVFSIFGREVAALLPGTRSMMVAPVVTADRVISLLIARSTKPEAFSDEHLGVLSRIADYTGGALANNQLYARTVQLAEEREARLQLDSHNRQLEEANEARTMFLSAVSHELRTPLTSIIAFTDILMKNRDGSFSDRDMHQLEIMRRNEDQLRVLVNDLLDLSHLQSGKLRLQPTEFSARTALEEIVSSLRPITGTKRQAVVVSGPADGEVTVVADRHRFGQVLSNLLSNASKYSGQSSVISISWVVDSARLSISVSDKGSGIPASEVRLLFEPFFRSSSHRQAKIPGTGLGLVISKTLIEAHGGEISIRSEHGVGTTVSFWIPLDGTGMTREQAHDKVA